MKQILVPGVRCHCYKKLDHMTLALGLGGGWEVKSHKEAVSEKPKRPR